MQQVSVIYGKKRYSLYAFVQHLGDSTVEGHYVSFFKDGAASYKYNSTSRATITEVTAQFDKNKMKAYILYYKLADLPDADSPLGDR